MSSRSFSYSSLDLAGIEKSFESYILLPLSFRLLLGNAFADAAGPAGDKHGFSFKIEFHVVSMNYHVLPVCKVKPTGKHMIKN